MKDTVYDSIYLMAEAAIEGTFARNGASITSGDVVGAPVRATVGCGSSGRPTIWSRPGSVEEAGAVGSLLARMFVVVFGVIPWVAGLMFIGWCL